MSQISPPVRIVAVVAVAFLALYMLVLRPKDSTVAPPPAAAPTGNVHTGKPAVTKFGKAVQAAQGAADATEKQMQGEARSAGAPDTASATPKSSSSTHKSASSSPSGTSAAAAAAPKVDVSGLPRPVAHAVRRHKVLALLFWNGRSADDHAVRDALRHVQRFDGAVYVHVAPLKEIARYGRITRGADVQQSPTVVVVDRKLKATTLVGYVDSLAINQAVVDALRASGGIFTDAYLKRVNKMCSSTVHDLNAIPQPMSVAQGRHDVRSITDRWDRFAADFRGVPAPAKWHSFKRATMSDLHTVTASNHRVLRGLHGHPSLASLVQLATTEIGAVVPAAKRLNHRMDRNGLVFCGSLN